MSVESKIAPPTVALIILVLMGMVLVTSLTPTAMGNPVPQYWYYTYYTYSPYSSYYTSQQGSRPHSVYYGGYAGYYPYYSYYRYYPYNSYYYGNYPSSYYSYYPSYRYYSYSPYYSYYPYYSGYPPIAIHQLTIATNGHGSTFPSIGNRPYSAGTSVTVTAYPGYGESLVKWTIDGVDQAPSPTVAVLMNADHTVTAYFTGGP